ncbi:glycosyl hydrolase [uncultured Alistipes sp.]|jgi:hypothetical protein|uniref:glycosyl hydrolase n=1 Tax=uncultured Alistipes sp. TaxID=538949 RepID=UPI0025DA52CA|nr:glycosyl hydrolase [uncultured Alistipes sp.]
MKQKILIALLFAAFLTGFAYAEKLPVVKTFRPEKELYKVFKNPDERHRPYVRWWWNGSRVNEGEILRELDLMQQAGIGGVEINTIQFPDQTADTVGYAALPVLSAEWLRMVNIAAEGCRERGMICDIIVGSGWPFGGEFLATEEQSQMLYPVTIDVKGGQFTIGRDEVLEMAHTNVFNPRENPTKELMFIRLMPKNVDTFTEGVAYDKLIGNQTISIDVPQGDYVLYFFVRRIGYTRVINGAPGASGPVVNHLDAKAVDRYLDHFSDAMQFTKGSLKGKIRAAFCDSFELEGNNWTPGMLEQFEKRMGYSLYPYLPYVIHKTGGMGEPVREAYGCNFSAEVTREVVDRVRNDFWHVQMQLFKENFIDVYNKWCHRNGLKSRVQAYGHQLHPIEASMYIDIPESESWIHDGIGRVLPANEYLTGRGYSQANKYVSSGSFLSGRNIVSCEEQTNVGNIFTTTLEEIKVTGDRSNLSGVNHSILHGFNYSPPQQDPLGWIQFGTYFHENNTWWPYVRLWMDYKARVSALLQNSVFQADIAILPPLEDLWSIHGMQRDPYPGVTYPAYANDLWEAVQQSGNGCDYVSENIIRQSTVGKGRLRFGSRSYNTLLLMEVESLEPETASRIADFVAAGGRVLSIGKVPYQSLGLKDAAQKNSRVKNIIDKVIASHPDRFICVESPEGDILEWYLELQRKHGLTPYAKLSAPDRFLMTNCYKSGDKDIYFIVNSSIERALETTVEFPAAVAAKQAWLWDAETGERYTLPMAGNSLRLRMGPAEAKILVFDKERGGKELTAPAQPNPAPVALNGVWDVKATHHFDKTVKEFQLTDLVDLHSLPFPWLQNFSGTVEYSLTVDIEDLAAFHTLDAGLTHNGLTELLINGESVGIRWYGERVFDVSGKLKKGENLITVRVTTTMTNYVKSRAADLPTARRWEWAQRLNKETGMRGPVVLY